MFNRKYIFKGSIFQPAMLVYQSVISKKFKINEALFFCRPPQKIPKTGAVDSDSWQSNLSFTIVMILSPPLQRFGSPRTIYLYMWCDGNNQKKIPSKCKTSAKIKCPKDLGPSNGKDWTCISQGCISPQNDASVEGPMILRVHLYFPVSNLTLDIHCHLLRRYLEAKNIKKTPSEEVFGCLLGGSSHLVSG